MAETDDNSNILPRREVIYCGACGMPPEYCEYGPDFETHCDPWLAKHHPELHQLLSAKRVVKRPAAKKVVKEKTKPERPWTVEERLRAFYEKYMPEKAETVPSLMEKYEGKEDKLFDALVKKYGPEPVDPYYSDSEDEDTDGEEVADETGAPSKKNRRGASAKKGEAAKMRVVIQKIAQKKKRNLTIVMGMETVPNLKLKDVSKMFSKKFAGSSSVKETATGEKEIIIQGDHMYDVAEMVVDTFGVPDSCVFLDMDGEVVPLR